MPSTNAERMRKSRQRKEQRGLKSVQVWVPDGYQERIKRLAEALRRAHSIESGETL